MSNKITRECFMYPDIAKVAISKETMYDMGKDGEVVEVPIPESIKATGIIPEGYSIDYTLDPATVVAALANINMTAIEHLSDAFFAEMKEIMNDPDNVTIAPSSVVESVSNDSLVSLLSFHCARNVKR
ncbi:hypothetical protein AX14_014200 [Amanita brunnescens Koide BX004]|nr:hypothetical protein AX14_014200 [Amanita brunnescens Koide BX004]